MAFVINLSRPGGGGGRLGTPSIFCSIELNSTEALQTPGHIFWIPCPTPIPAHTLKRKALVPPLSLTFVDDELLKPNEGRALFELK